MLWNMSVLEEILSTSEIPCTVEVGDRGGEWDLNEINLIVDGVDDHLVITPFVDPSGPGAPEENENVEICALEVKTFRSDDAGGFQSDDEALFKLYNHLKFKFKKLSFNVIDNYEEIF